MASSSTASMLLMSGILRCGAVAVSEVCNELRLFASGPCGGLPEISLPPMAPGSSIMPGEVNLVIPEVMNMGGFETIGNDTTVVSDLRLGSWR